MATRLTCRNERRRLPIAVRHCLCVILALCLALVATKLRAASGQVIYLPTGNTKPKNGLKLVIDTRWIDGNGYRPVRVDAINWPPGPTGADRTIRLVLQPNSYHWMASQQRVTQYIEMPQGASRVTTTVSVPQDHIWRSLEVSVYEDGYPYEDLSGEVGIGVRANEWSEANPAVLIIDSDAPTRDVRANMMNTIVRGGTSNDPRRLPDIRFLSEIFPSSFSIGGNAAAMGGKPNDQMTLNVVQLLPKVDLLPPTELPERWIDYTCCDIIVVSFADLKMLTVVHSTRWRAIRDWVRSGPTLCVYDMDLSQEQLDELSRLLEVPSAEREGNEESQPTWRRPNQKTADSAVRAVREVHEHYNTYIRPQEDASESSVVDVLTQALLEIQPPDSDPFLYRRVGLGHVVAMGTAEPFQRGDYEMPWLLNELGANKWMWYQRHGMSLHRENTTFWNWMIPGVGRAPVGSYLLLITAFVVVIGPVNYFLLRKRKRLYMLLVTVPIGAGLVTAALLSYALISDGLGVRARVRSYTQIDQRSGHVVSWSRQSYYAGLAPSGGLAYPDDAAVYPIFHFPSDRQGRHGTRHLYWDGDQNLLSGYMGARSTAQFMVVRSASSQRGLTMEKASGGTAAPLVTNRLGTRIAEIVLSNPSGQFFSARDIEPGAQFKPEPTTPRAAIDRVRVLVDGNRPEFPPGYDQKYYGRGVAFGGFYYGGWSDVDQSLPPPSFGLGLLERSIAEAKSGSGAGRLPGSYIAVTDSSPETPLGYGRAREEASLHVIVGRW